MKAFPPVQFFSHGSCFLARKPAGENKYVATCTGTSGGKKQREKRSSCISTFKDGLLP